jgi:hypothetical protein
VADQTPNLILDGDIGLYEEARLTELVRQGFAFGQAPAGNEDFCAFLDKPLRGAIANPAGRPRDDCHLTL